MCTLINAYVCLHNLLHTYWRAEKREWIERGFDDGVFLLAGSLQPNAGGGVLAHNTSLTDLQGRVNSDPFVAENVVTAEILEMTPSKADARLNFMLD